MTYANMRYRVYTRLKPFIAAKNDNELTITLSFIKLVQLLKSLKSVTIDFNTTTKQYNINFKDQIIYSLKDNSK